MAKDKSNKRNLDKKRNEWRKKHKTLHGRIILHPDKLPEHINARASKTYNWFWKNILLAIKFQDIPAVITNIKKKIKFEQDNSRIRIYRTMISMAEDAYQFKKIEGILEYDNELLYSENPVYNAEQGVIYKNGNIFTADYNEDESSILVRDIEGILVDIQYSQSY